MAEQNQASGEFALPILPLVKDKQANNGIKNGNYLRYRTYCTKKLRKLREKLQFTHRETKSKKQVPFFKRDVTSVKDYFQQLQAKSATPDQPIAIEPRRSVQLLSMVLFQCERAWSFAMQLKQELAEKDDAQQRHHYLQRLSKATKWSQKLEQLAKECFDMRSQLEAEAYHSWMQANLLLAREQWKEAQERFVHARTIYDNLSKVGRAAQKEIYRRRVEEVDPSIRFCVYNLNKNSSDADILSLIDSSDNHGLDLLKSKLEEVLEETRRNQAKTMEEVEWNGRKIAIENEKVRVHLINVEGTKTEIDNCQNLDGKIRLYDKLFITLTDCQKLVRDDLKLSSKKDDQKFIASTKLLHSYLLYIQLMRTIDRNVLLIQNTIEKLEEEAGSRKKSDKKRLTTPLDIVRLYEVVLQNLSDLMELMEGSEAELQQRHSFFKAYRCLYLGKEYAANEQWKEALALYDQSQVLFSLAKQSSDAEAAFVKQVKQAKCVAKAQYILSKANKQQVDDVFESSSVVNEKQAVQEDVLHRLDSFSLDRRGKPYLVAFPPNYEHVPAKPIFFDVANNNIKQPDISSKLSKKGWFGWF